MARSPRLTRRFGEQRAALALSAAALSDVGKKIRILCSADALPEPDHRTRLAPHPEDDRGVDLLVDVGRVGGRRLWLCYRASEMFVTIDAIYDHPPPYDP